MATAQRLDVKAVRKWERSSSYCKQILRGEEVWMYHGKLVVPESAPELVYELLQLAHEGCHHGGCKRTCERVTNAGVHIAGLDSIVEEYVASCWACQRVKPAKGPRKHGLMGARDDVSAPLQVYVADYIGKLKESTSGNKYILVIMDWATRYTRLFATSVADGETSIACMEQMFMMFGYPREMQFDGGWHLDCKAVRDYLKEKGVKLHVSTPYHPQSNGVVERLNKVVLDAVRAEVGGARLDEWDKELAAVQLSVNTAVNRSIGVSPMVALLGREGGDVVSAQLGVQWLTRRNLGARFAYLDQIREGIIAMQNRARAEYKEDYDADRVEVSFPVGSQVLVATKNRTNKLEFWWRGPYTVLGEAPDSGGLKYRVKELASVSGRTEHVHVDRMIAYDGSRYSALTEIARQLEKGTALVTQVVAHSGKGKKMRVKVKWLTNDDAVEERWEPVGKLKRIALVEEYLKAHGLA